MFEGGWRRLLSSSMLGSDKGIATIIPRRPLDREGLVSAIERQPMPVKVELKQKQEYADIRTPKCSSINLEWSRGSCVQRRRRRPSFKENCTKIHLQKPALSSMRGALVTNASLFRVSKSCNAQGPKGGILLVLSSIDLDNGSFLCRGWAIVVRLIREVSLTWNDEVKRRAVGRLRSDSVQKVLEAGENV